MEARMGVQQASQCPGPMSKRKWNLPVSKAWLDEVVIEHEMWFQMVSIVCKVTLLQINKFVYLVKICPFQDNNISLTYNDIQTYKQYIIDVRYGWISDLKEPL